jgi:hypothetical protein
MASYYHAFPSKHKPLPEQAYARCSRVASGGTCALAHISFTLEV